MADIGSIDHYDEVETQSSLEALPAGPYTVAIIESDCVVKDTAQGRRINVTYEVQSGPYQGRKGWDKFDIDRVANTKDGPKMIDLSRFKTLVAALGFDTPPSDTSQMHGVLFVATAKVKQDDPNYAPKNDWNGYRPASGGAVQSAPAPQQTRQPAPQRQAPPPPQAANGGRMAWPARR